MAQSMPPGGVHPIAYAQPILPGLLAAASLFSLLGCLESTKVELASRAMDVRRIVSVQLAIQVSTILVTILTATVIASAWAIITGMVCGSIVSLVLSYAAYPGPRMAWNTDPVLAGRLWRFGRWIIVSSSLTFVQTTADKFILAALLSPVSFGHYVIALIWVEAGGQLAGSLRGRIFFPAFSEIGLSRPQDLPRIYRRLKRLEDFYLFAAFSALSFGAPFLIDILYPDDYAEAAHFLSLAAISLLMARFNTMAELLVSLGESRVTATAAAIRTVGLICALPLGWLVGGVEGLIIANALHSCAQLPFLFRAVKRSLPPLDLTEDYAAVLVILAIIGLVLIPGWMP
jgi:O-antigen/teichoic acid export membrane protein